MNLHRTIWLVLLFLPAAIEALSQSARGSLTVLTTPDSAWVYVDDRAVVRSPVRVDSLAQGRHVVRVLHPHGNGWLSASLCDTISIAPGASDTLRRRLEEPWLISTNPSGAQVYVGDSLMGVTPLILARRDLPVRLEKGGYASRTVAPPSAERSASLVTLSKRWIPGEVEDSPFVDGSGSAGTTVRLVVTGAAAVLFGGASAYFKIKADDENAVYLETQDAAHRTERQKLDTAAAISLLASQASFILFLNYLMSE
jgi:hypothetical protein